MRTIKIAILGFGQRGNIYGQYALVYPQEFEVVAVADNSEARRALAAKSFSCPIYSDYQSLLAAKPQADLIVVSTDDNVHEEHAIACIKAGYDLLLEKPIANHLDSCQRIEAAAKAHQRKVIVCHVLRYTPFYRTVKTILDEGKLGEIVTVEASENVGYYHQAHSFVRGPWRNKAESSPMILAKCCHDMDILRWLIGKECLSVASFGGLSVFKKECAPKGATAYCSDCPVEDCVYKAQKIYSEYQWMTGYFNAVQDSKEVMLQKLRHSQYDRCVYGGCDNDVVDHQVTVMQFAEGITVTHSMTAFSKEIYRDLKIHGTKAELYGVMESGELEIRTYGGDTEKVKVHAEFSVGGHGGGDSGMMHELYLAFNGQPTKGISYLDVSIDSHYMSFSAEESRLAGGMVVNIKDKRQ